MISVCFIYGLHTVPTLLESGLYINMDINLNLNSYACNIGFLIIINKKKENVAAESIFHAYNTGIT